jgi:hypothetical protein
VPALTATLSGIAVQMAHNNVVGRPLITRRTTSRVGIPRAWTRWSWPIRWCWSAGS